MFQSVTLGSHVKKIELQNPKRLGTTALVFLQLRKCMNSNSWNVSV